jgi:hypothetical protein
VARHGRGIADPLEAAPPTFTFGQDLLTFFVNAVAGAHPPSPSVSTRVGGIGRLAGLAESLHAGGAVDLAGLGRLHSGGYRVTVLRRHFNQSQGNFVEFEVQRHALGDA